MAGVALSIDTSDLRKADLWLATIRGELDFVSSRAITATAKSIHANLRRRLPTAVHSPTSWTTRGLLVKYASRRDPVAMVGFNYGDKYGPAGSFGPGGFVSKMGVPSGRYMDVLARGGSRQAKSTELSLRRAGAIPYGSFITPAGYGIGKPNAAGNVTGGRYMLLLSRFRANLDEGTTSNKPYGRPSRGTAAMRDVDLLMRNNKGRRSIAQRSGRGPKGGTGKGSGNPGRPQTVGYRRGLRAAFWVVDQPRYPVLFPVRQIAEAQFKAEIGGHFRTALEDALRNPKRS
jgi:hypothetical protein